MKLVVRIIEARNLPAMDLNGSSDPYVRLQLGRSRFRTKVVKKTLNPAWGEEFSFRVDDLSEDLIVSVLDEDRYFNDDFVGQLKVPISRVFDAEAKSLGTTWYTLHPKTKKGKNRNCGMAFLNFEEFNLICNWSCLHFLFLLHLVHCFCFILKLDSCDMIRLSINFGMLA